MAVDEDLAKRVRAVLAGSGELREVRMFGGLCFMLNGNMVAGTSKRGLLVRVGKEQHAPALARPDARPMEMSGRPMEGYGVIDPPPKDDRVLREWIELAVAFVQTLAGKAAEIERAAEHGEVVSGAERDDRIEQDARAAQTPQHKGGDAQQEGGGPC
jgi:TfoX/Sxy family transcriptional regulator of competence genes